MGITNDLKAAIERSGLTRYAIAKGAGIDWDTLAAFLDGSNDPRLSSVEKLAEFLGVNALGPSYPGVKRPKRKS